MKTITLSAPAKTNLSLRILSKRDDGFHEIDTLMVKLPGLADQITISLAEEFSFECSDPELPQDHGNLVIKSLNYYKSEIKENFNCSILLIKNIPHGAGLGGGSSDAAATLIGLNQLFDYRLNPQELSQLASELGSDIPFFLTAGAARCTGRGEMIAAVSSPPALPILLLKPAFSVATPDAYKRWKQSFEISSVDYKPQKVSGISLVNDLERPVFEKHRFLAELKQWLLGRSEVAAAMLSGSGSTVFAILHDLADAEKVAKAARDELDPTLWHWAGMTEEI
ncbi:MAG: 4-(cytidine 5'-diphospho)-2-C-methyl-D-erythritol kinase [Akkermansiaceae bacterium]|nr:4-(cytidine 5'-diphospho)-2-C-methyl-D-erythritol kinase [Akkermansiaceae bacterium]